MLSGQESKEAVIRLCHYRIKRERPARQRGSRDRNR